jgi:quercetin dioxygenase-like cupin family protein
MKVNVGNDSRVLGPGDSHYLASNVPHGVETLEDTRVLDTFSPPRHEYIALDEQAKAH